MPNNIKTFEEFRFQKLPDFQFERKLKRIIIDVNGDVVIGQAGAWSGIEVSSTGPHSEMEEPKNNFYFKTDKTNTDILKKHGIAGVESINDKDRIITFKLRNGGTMECHYKIKWFSKEKIGNWYVPDKEGGYVEWSI